MEKCPIEMTTQELEEAIERAELVMYLAYDYAKTERERIAIVSEQVARIRLLRQHFKARIVSG